MKHSDRLGELVLRLSVNQDFVELWKLVKTARDECVRDAIHNNEGNPAEKRGAARELDNMINVIDSAPGKAKKLREIGK